MTPSAPGHYRAAPFALRAEWVVEEADLHAAAKALPGSTLSLFRWPAAFFIAYVGIGLADRSVGPAFTFGSASVIVIGWIVLSLGSRGTHLRRIARLPELQRASRLTIDADRFRHEAASGHAGEYPLADLTHARMVDAGVMLDVRGQVFFVPRRAIRGTEPAWEALVASVSSRPWPIRLGYTLGVWAVALVVAGYAFVK